MIDASELAMVQSICQQCEFTRPWQQGDLLVLDNHLTLHGRSRLLAQRSGGNGPLSGCLVLGRICAFTGLVQRFSCASLPIEQ